MYSHWLPLATASGSVDNLVGVPTTLYMCKSDVHLPQCLLGGRV